MVENHFFDAETNEEFEDIWFELEWKPNVGEELRYWKENSEDRDHSIERFFIVTRVRHYLDVHHSDARTMGLHLQSVGFWLREVPAFD
jgi:hypothetical protein